MSSFHPATVAILREARAAALQNLAKGRRDADYMASIGEPDTGLLFLDSAIEARAIVADLDRLLKVTSPAPAVEETLPEARGWAVAQKLVDFTADIPVFRWEVDTDKIAVYPRGNTPLESRSQVSELALRFGLSYAESVSGHSATCVHFDATGEVDGIKVRFHSTAFGVDGFCARHEVAIIDGICDGCENTVREDQLLQPWEHELLATAADPTPESTAAAEQRAATDAADAEAEEADLLTARADDAADEFDRPCPMVDEDEERRLEDAVRDGLDIERCPKCYALSHGVIHHSDTIAQDA